MLFDDPKFCNQVVHIGDVGNDVLYCSRFILAQKSKYFETFFSTDLKCSDSGNPTLLEKFKPIARVALNRLHETNLLTNTVIDLSDMPLLVEFCDMYEINLNLYPEYTKFCRAPIGEIGEFLSKLEFLPTLGRNVSLLENLSDYFRLHRQQIYSLEESFGDAQHCGFVEVLKFAFDALDSKNKYY